MELQDIMNYGFIIYKSSPTKWSIKKITTPADGREITVKQDFENFDMAHLHVVELIKDCTFKFDVIVRYNRGLGPEFKNLDRVEAKTIQEAQKMAEANAEKVLKKKVIEVKVRPVAQ